MNFFASVELKGLNQNSCMKTDGDTKYRLSYWKNISGGGKSICWNAYVTRVTSVAVLLWPVPKIESNEMIGTSERFARKSFNKLNNKPIKMLLGSASVTFSYLKIICIRDYNECWYFGPKQFIDFSQRLRSQV